MQFIKEDHTLEFAMHFSVGKIVANLQRYVHYPRMQEEVDRFIRGCILCYTSKPNNRKQGLYNPFTISTRPWEIISMDYVHFFKY
jgi:hypothetical protein